MQKYCQFIPRILFTRKWTDTIFVYIEIIDIGINNIFILHFENKYAQLGSMNIKFYVIQRGKILNVCFGKKIV